MDLSVITVNFNSGKRILEQIASVARGAQGLEFEQIISDNGSTDESVAEIKKNFPAVKIIENGKNLGFGAANNRALSYASGEFLLFLNPDMHISAGSLATFVGWMRSHPEVGIAGPKLLNENGNFNQEAKPRRFPQIFDQLIIMLKLHHFFPGLLDEYLYKNFNADYGQEVDTVRGSAMLMRRKVAQKLGWAFDPRYFIWFEDIDVCREAKRLGYKVMYTPIISAIDYVGETFRRQSSSLKQRWFTKSMLQYFKKWEPPYRWIWIALARPAVMGLVYFASLAVRLRQVLKIAAPPPYHPTGGDP